MWDGMAIGHSPDPAQPETGLRPPVGSRSARAARKDIVGPGLHEIDTHVEQWAVVEVGPDRAGTLMSKGSLRGLGLSAGNLKSPATETRTEPMHHRAPAIAVPQVKLAHPVVQ